jgi:hypothetical protein
MPRRKSPIFKLPVLIQFQVAADKREPDENNVGCIRENQLYVPTGMQTDDVQQPGRARAIPPHRAIRLGSGAL